MTAQRSPSRRPTPPDDRITRSTNVLLQRVVVVDGDGAAELATALEEQGISARVVSPDTLSTMVAGLVVLRTGDPDAAGAVQALRARQTSLAAIALGEPADGLRFADVTLPARVPTATLALQLRALARLLALEPPADEPELITVRNLTIDLERREVRASGKAVPLTPTEFRILALLARRPGRVVSHAEIFREIHGYDVSDFEAKDILKVHIWRLRSKLTEFAPDISPIVNVRGFGYLLERRARERRARPSGNDGDQT